MDVVLNLIVSNVTRKQIWNSRSSSRGMIGVGSLGFEALGQPERGYREVEDSLKGACVIGLAQNSSNQEPSPLASQRTQRNQETRSKTRVMLHEANVYYPKLFCRTVNHGK